MLRHATGQLYVNEQIFNMDTSTKIY